MGTTYHVAYVDSLLSFKKQKIKQALSNALSQVDHDMSTYKYNSELMKLNRAPINKPIKISKPLFTVIQQSLEIAKLSHGAYDITVGPLVNLWGFGPSQKLLKIESHINQKTQKDNKINTKDNSDLLSKSASDQKNIEEPNFILWQTKQQPPTIPSADEIKQNLKKVGYQALVLNEKQQTITLKKKVFIDLSSIAKGFGTDQAAQALENYQIKSYMVEVGGEIKVKGQKPDGAFWRLAVNHPSLQDSAPMAIIAPQNNGVATSGDYLNFFVYQGKHYAHTINPKTGYPVQHNLIEVSVIAPTVTQADGLATMFMVLGEKKGFELAQKHHFAVFFVYRHDNVLDCKVTKSFNNFIVQTTAPCLKQATNTK